MTVGSDGIIVMSDITMPSLSVGSQKIVESDTGTRNKGFSVTMSHAVPYAFMVQVDTTGETAQAGPDYQPQHLTLTFAPGATTASFTVPIIGNTIFEPDRAFEVNLSNAVGATIAAPTTILFGTNGADTQADARGISTMTTRRRGP